jgi:general secretion pathway protein H
MASRPKRRSPDTAWPLSVETEGRIVCDVKRARKAAKGFTLIEMLVVLAIMALVVTLLTPMMRIGRSGADLRSARSEMLAAMRTARSTAISQNRTTAIVLDPVRGRYAEPNRDHVLPNGMIMSWRALWPVAGHDDLGAIYFFPDGSASGGEIDLRTRNATSAVVVDWFSGYASAHD